ncbi:MAG: Kae1-associated serine/threonine protein kinase [Candidatus Diapherotrites archaeon]|uniref:non-specific serine/threonine protein kinase n=1 Tax=Candidatus Iainarchaeum sp. TaxID=3101447 RepID=A0A8T4KWG4_9ARCH|nr:MAG: bifunctional tRNA threonylcarbamoyladenosine biosynthesis protein [archaeon GW2011_AR21]MBS3058701.1 Kae1-associated serine/threonine protein kinase [Candidatus Diapherotrites archaeon]
MPETLLRKGAEAELLLSEYLGKKVLVKRRIAKDYRVKELDERIRKERTKLEAGLLHNAKLQGVRTPFIRKIGRKNFEIVMELVEGKRLKDALDERNSGKYCKKLAEQIALLHNAGIIHGDLTTSNVIVNGRDFCLIDFGLGFYSEKIEDRAVDLLNLKKTFQATHFKLFKAWGGLELEYVKKAKDGARVLSQVKEIEKRARYS